MWPPLSSSCQLRIMERACLLEFPLHEQHSRGVTCFKILLPFCLICSLVVFWSGSLCQRWLTCSLVVFSACRPTPKPPAWSLEASPKLAADPEKRFAFHVDIRGHANRACLNFGDDHPTPSFVSLPNGFGRRRVTFRASSTPWPWRTSKRQSSLSLQRGAFWRRSYKEFPLEMMAWLRFCRAAAKLVISLFWFW